MVWKSEGATNHYWPTHSEKWVGHGPSVPPPPVPTPMLMTSISVPNFSNRWGGGQRVKSAQGTIKIRSSFILRITHPQSSVTPPLAGPSGRRPPGMWRSPEPSPGSGGPPGLRATHAAWRRWWHPPKARLDHPGDVHFSLLKPISFIPWLWNGQVWPKGPYPNQTKPNHQNPAEIGFLFRFDPFSCHHLGGGLSHRYIKLRPWWRQRASAHPLTMGRPPWVDLGPWSPVCDSPAISNLIFWTIRWLTVIYGLELTVFWLILHVVMHEIQQLGYLNSQALINPRRHRGWVDETPLEFSENNSRTGRGSRISARGGRQGNDDLIWDENERFLTYANTDLQLFNMLIAILCLNGVEQPFKRHQCPFFLPLRRGNPRLRRGSFRPEGWAPRPSVPPPGSVPANGSADRHETWYT